MLSAKLIALMLEIQSRGLPQDIRRKTRLHIIDTFGIALAAAHASPVARMVLQSLCFGGTTGECRVIGYRDRLPPAFAAMANSALAHTMDYDDIHDIARVHPSAVTLPAALAAASVSGCSGGTIIEAVALGNELMCRLGAMLKALGTGPGADWFLTQLFGYLGGCLAAGLVLELTEEQHVAAQGLVYMQLAGGKEAAFGVGSNARSIYTGFSAMSGVQSALLAKAGMVGPDSSLDGKAGMMPLYLGMRPSKEQLDDLLRPDIWKWSEAGIKPWPCCRSSHPYVSVALELSGKVRPGQIDRVTVAVNASGARLCKPIADRRRPRTLPDAKYSIPFVTAFALAKGSVTLQNLNEGTLDDPEVAQLAQQVEFEESLVEYPGPAPAQITIKLKDGSTLSGKLSSNMMLSDEDVLAKFVSCLGYAGLAEHAHSAWQQLQRFDTLSIDQIFDALQSPESAPS